MANTYSLDLELSSSQHAWVADNADVSVTGDLTAEVYIKLEQTAGGAGSSMSLVSKWDTGNDDRSYNLHLDTSDDKLYLFASDDGTLGDTHTVNFKTTTTFTTTGTWIHVAAAFDISAETCNFYVNGTEEGGTKTGTSIGAAMDDNASKFAIGTIFIAGTANWFFDGKIDEVRLSNKVRSEAEIQDNYQKEITPDANHVGYWKLNNNYADSAKSSDLTAAGSPVFSTDVPFTEVAGGSPMFFSGGLCIG